MGEAVVEKLPVAAREWLELYRAGNIANDEVFKNWLGALELERTYEDGSILRWSDRMGGWRFYRNSDERARRHSYE